METLTKIGNKNYRIDFTGRQLTVEYRRYEKDIEEENFCS